MRAVQLPVLGVRKQRGVRPYLGRRIQHVAGNAHHQHRRPYGPQFSVAQGEGVHRLGQGAVAVFAEACLQLLALVFQVAGDGRLSGARAALSGLGQRQTFRRTVTEHRHLTGHLQPLAAGGQPDGVAGHHIQPGGPGRVPRRSADHHGPRHEVRVRAQPFIDLHAAHAAAHHRHARDTQLTQQLALHRHHVAQRERRVAEFLGTAAARAAAQHVAAHDKLPGRVERLARTKQRGPPLVYRARSGQGVRDQGGVRAGRTVAVTGHPDIGHGPPTVEQQRVIAEQRERLELRSSLEPGSWLRPLGLNGYPLLLGVGRASVDRSRRRNSRHIGRALNYDVGGLNSSHETFLRKGVRQRVNAAPDLMLVRGTDTTRPLTADTRTHRGNWKLEKGDESQG